jgi:hypothetical protein
MENSPGLFFLFFFTFRVSGRAGPRPCRNCSRFLVVYQSRFWNPLPDLSFVILAGWSGISPDIDRTGAEAQAAHQMWGRKQENRWRF